MRFLILISRLYTNSFCILRTTLYKFYDSLSGASSYAMRFMRSESIFISIMCCAAPALQMEKSERDGKGL